MGQAMTEFGKTFIESFDAIQGETILWEGRPSKKAYWPQLYEYALPFIVLILFIAFLIFVSMMPDNDSDKCVDKTIETVNTSGDAVKADDKVQTKCQRNNGFPTELMYFFSWVCVPICICLPIVSYLRIRSYQYIITSERVIIQSGVLGSTVTTLDLDKVVSINSSQSPIEKMFNVISIELVHAGVTLPKNGFGNIRNLNQIKFINKDLRVSSKLIKSWLPRDNQ